MGVVRRELVRAQAQDVRIMVVVESGVSWILPTTKLYG